MPACGHEYDPEARFCSRCGTRLEDGGRPRREERKVIAVLFADLVGFTQRAEQLDPEDVRAILEPYHAHLRAELERFGGSVEKFIGDAVMAVFGAPTAHEDDPERAVRAALAIRDWAQEEGIDLRIGINTGVALVTISGEPMAAGDVVSTAARLQAGAPVGGILVGDETQRATARVIDYRPLAPLQAKGKAEPVAAWEVVEARARADEYLARLRSAGDLTAWHPLAIAIIEGDARGSVELVERVGSRPLEAYVRLSAAETLLRDGRADEARPALEEALAFWRSVDAARNVGQAEAMLAAP